MKKPKKVLTSQIKRRIIKQISAELGFKEGTINTLLNSEDDMDNATVLELLNTDSGFSKSVLLNLLTTDDEFAKKYIKKHAIKDVDFNINIRDLVRKAEATLKKK